MTAGIVVDQVPRIQSMAWDDELVMDDYAVVDDPW